MSSAPPATSTANEPIATQLGVNESPAPDFAEDAGEAACEVAVDAVEDVPIVTISAGRQN